MSGLWTTWTRATAFLAVFAYTLLPGVALAECGCPDCVCFTAEDPEGCCCSSAAELPACCHTETLACQACGTAENAATAVSCLCEQYISAQAPAPQTKRTEASTDQAEAPLFAAALPVSPRPQSEAPLTTAELDPSAHSPRLHLLNCVWRN